MKEPWLCYRVAGPEIASCALSRKRRGATGSCQQLLHMATVHAAPFASCENAGTGRSNVQQASARGRAALLLAAGHLGNVAVVLLLPSSEVMVKSAFKGVGKGQLPPSPLSLEEG